MVTRFQERALKKFRARAIGWERAANYVGIGNDTFQALIDMGYLEERREGNNRQQWWLRITDKGNRALDKGLW